jgi:hypothetical protein
MESVVGEGQEPGDRTVAQEEEEEMLMPLTDLSAGSISEQLTSNAQFSLDASDFNLADGLDDLD